MDELDRLVNACLMPGFLGRSPTPWVEQALGEDLAGVCLYGHNLTDDESVRRISTAVRAASPDALVALDEETGDVTRLDYLTGSRYPGNLALGVVDDTELTRDVARSVAADLAEVGVSYNFAPSVDVNSDPRNPVIGVRSFGSDTARVAAHGAAFVRGLEECGIAASAKHFPGHGHTGTDSHLALPVIDCDLETFRSRELPPFVAAIEAGVRSIMTTHIVFPALDELPATLSRRVLTGLLREELGYDGVIVTDALDMAGVRADHGIDGAAVKALVAGADLLLLGAEDGEVHCAAVRRAVRAAVSSGELSQERLQDAAARVGELRSWTTQARSDMPRPKDGVGIEAARRAVTSGGDQPLARLAPGSEVLVVEVRAETNMAVGNASWSLAQPLEGCGIKASVRTVAPDGPDPRAVVRDAEGLPLVLAVRDAYRHPWQREWVRQVMAARPDAVLVGLGMAEHRDIAGQSWVLAYGAGRVNTQAAAEVLTGHSSERNHETTG